MNLGWRWVSQGGLRGEGDGEECVHLVEGRRDVAHQAHEEEGDLEDGVGDEV